MASGTLLSRLTGFARVLALVYAFRLTRLADIYNLANTAPNILYDLVLGGVLSATLVPVFVDWFGRDEEEGWRAVSAVVTAITVTLAVLTAVFWLLAPAIIRLYLVLDHSPGGADQRALGTTLLRLFAPQLFLLGGIALTTALLNARRRFFVPAYSPVLNNLVTIAAIVAAPTGGHQPRPERVPSRHARGADPGPRDDGRIPGPAGWPSCPRCSGAAGGCDRCGTSATRRCEPCCGCRCGPSGR